MEIFIEGYNCFAKCYQDLWLSATGIACVFPAMQGAYEDLVKTLAESLLTVKNFLIVLLLAAAFARAGEDIPERFGGRLEEVRYPFPVQVFAFESQRENLEMAYMDVAPEKPNGRAVLLLHGKNFNGYYWESTIKVLTAAGFRVVVPDQIGFGKSTKPQRYQFTFQQLATNTRALLDKLGIEHLSVIGHSMGGMLAVRFALMFPDRVERLVLIDPIGLEDWKRMVPYRTVDEWYAGELKVTPDEQKRYQMESYYHGDWKPEYERWVRLATGWLSSPDYPSVAWNSALTYDMIFTQPVLYELDDLDVPTLLVVGSLDRTAIGKQWASDEVKETLGDYPNLAKSAAAEISECQLEILEGVGHVPQIEAPDRLFPIVLKFLQDSSDEP
jgi:pimeloyl-ACP methyl ester carboxylesterase